MPIIYGHKNTITNKWYIGQTWNTIDRRVGSNFINYKGSIRFYNSILKYGSGVFDTFEFWRCAVCSQELLNWVEVFYINIFNSIEDGYNIKDGGSKGKLSQDTKRKLSKSIRKYFNDNPREVIYNVAEEQLIQWNHIEGLNLEEMKVKIGCSTKSVVKKMFKRLGIEYIKRKTYNITKEQLIQWNHIEGLDLSDICSIIGCSFENTVKRHFIKCNIEYISPYIYNVTKEQLIQWNYIEGKNLREISNNIGCGSESSVLFIFKRLGIEYKKPNVSKFKYNITKEQLIQWNHIEGKNLREISELVGCANSSSVKKFFKRFNIEYRQAWH